MKKKKENKVHLPMRPLKKLMLALLAVAAVFAVVYGIYYLVRYTFEDRYKKYKETYTYEDGFDFQAVKEASSDVPGFVLVTENDKLKLYTKTATAEVAIFDKRDGSVTYSNPQDADSDTVANKINKNYLKSQFILTYFNKNAMTGNYDSYSMCTERGQVTCEGIENGIRYIYDVGNYEKSSTGIVPLYLTPEKYEEVQQRMEAKAETGEITDKDLAALRRYYINSTNVEGMWELNSVTQKNIKAVQKIAAWFNIIEWTEEEYMEQMEIAGVEVAVPISFTVVLEYRLQDDGLVVSVPTCALKENGGGYFNRIQLLSYMGAAGSEENGYLVVPNGSGSVIHFNNGKKLLYNQYIYDLDPLLANYTQIENTDSAKLPIFGICRDDRTLLATVEEGKTLAMITAGVSGMFHNYNYAYSTFVIRSADNLVNFGESSTEVYVMEPDFYDVNLTVRYNFLNKENTGYSGIANYYRNRLIAEGNLTQTEESGDIPFYYDVIGAVKETKHIIGTRVLLTTAMTTFEQAKTMAEELKEQGISKQVPNYQGWFNGGYYHDAADQIKVLRKLGGKSDLAEFNRYISEIGGRLYADVAFQKVSYADTGFNYSAESSRYYGAGFVVSFGKVNPTTLRSTSGLDYMENKYDCLSPKFLPYYVDKFSKKIQSVDVDGISLRDLGNTLLSDKKRTNIINREEAYDIVCGQFETLQSTGKNLMVDSGFDYSLKYARDVINAPMRDNDFFLIDEEIPLYEMIFHGSVSYGSDLLNYYDQSDMDFAILKMIEYGAAPHYVFTWEESNKMKNTGLNNYYSTTFTTWKDTACETYKAVNDVLKNVTGAKMIKHEILSENVRAVTYDNGVCIYLNYGADDTVVNGISITGNGVSVEGVK